MTVLIQTVRHQANRHGRNRALARWLRHNVRRRLHPSRSLTVTLNGGRLTGPTDHPVMNSAVYAEQGLYDWDAFHAIIWLLDPGDWFVDVGANLGSHSVMAGHRVGATGHVWAFEPNDSVYEYLRVNLERLPGTVQQFSVALGAHRAVLAWEPAQGTRAHLHSRQGDDRVQVVPLDSFAERFPMDVHRCVAKIDVEGWEPAVIAGSGEWLTAGPRAVLVEAAGHSYRCPCSWEGLVATFLEHGYRFVWPEVRTRILHELDLTAVRPISPFHDYIAVRTDGYERLIDGLRYLPPDLRLSWTRTMKR